MAAPIRVDVARVFKPLLSPKRYKAAYGGRAGGKSNFFAEQMVIRCYAQETRAVCIREVQNTLKESARQLIIDKIASLELGAYFDVQSAEIRGTNGSLIIFVGMQTYNAGNIQSLEGFDIAWVEEAQNLSERSWRLLRPTIRKEGSEIWAGWNPRSEEDAVDKFFRSGKPRDDAIVIPVNWKDNPWLPDVLRPEIESDYANDPEMATHVWGGGYEIISEGSYYARLLATAENEGRIGDFPYNPAWPIDTAWDIGVDDYTSIWFVQNDGLNCYVIDYFEFSGMGPQEIVPLALPELDPDLARGFLARKEIERAEPFRYGEHFLPHDVRQREWGAGAKIRALTLMGLGVKPIHVGANLGQGAEAERVNAARRLIPLCFFNRTKRTALGLRRLRRYSRAFNETLGTYTKALHDENSHAADAFGEYAINCPITMPKPAPEKPKAQPRGTVVLEGPPKARSATRIRI